MPDLNPERLAEKHSQFMQITQGAVTAGCGHLGVKLGLYEAMQDRGPQTAAEVAEATALSERFVLEWLRQQTAAGIIDYRGDDRFELIPEAAAIVADTGSPLYAAGAWLGLPNTVAMFANAEGSFRTGRGQPFAVASKDRVEDVVRGPLQAWARNGLVQQALPKVEGMVERLAAGGVVADIGCGAGAAPIAIGKAFPRSVVIGYDTWPAILKVAERQRGAAGLTNVSFRNPNDDPLPHEPTFDLILTVDCVHDMTRPDLVAAQIRSAIKPDGVWFIVDVDAGETFEETLRKPAAAMLYGFSIIVCLQSGAAAPDGFALGNTGLPEPAMEALVRDAGFSSFERITGVTNPNNAAYVARP